MKVVRKKSVEKFKITHNWKLLLIIIGLVIILVFVIVSIAKNKNNVIGEKIVEGDSLECVPATCCHATECVSIDKSPDCSDIFCSQVCSGPLDCGAGTCEFINGACGVVNNE